MDNKLDIPITWQCNACGAKFNEPTHCSHCGAPYCPKCKATNSLINIRKWNEFVSDKVPTRASQMKRNGTKIKNKPKKTRVSKQDRLKKDLEELGLSM